MKFKATDKWYKEAAETETGCPEISAGYMKDSIREQDIQDDIILLRNAQLKIIDGLLEMNETLQFIKNVIIENYKVSSGVV